MITASDRSGVRVPGLRRLARGKMKIVCDSCSTKYSISDDKVRGKVFKIRCKKCSHIIVVRGTGEGAPAAAEAPADAVWHLVVDGDQVGPLSDAEVRARLSRGEISAENYIWKEGFADWLRLVDVPEFADVAAAAGPGSGTSGGDLFSDPAPISTATPVGSAQTAAGGRISGRHAAVGEQEGFFSGGAGGQDAPRSARTSGRMRAVEAAPQGHASQDDDAFAAPITTSRASEGGDLFGMAAPVAASRVDSGRVRSRGANGSGSARHDGGRVESLTAQRSENSVLFSLSNLQSLAAPAPTVRSTSAPTTEGSGLIDIRAMAASTLRAPSAPGALAFGPGSGPNKAAADDLPTFAAFSSAAPVLFPIPTSSGPPKWIYALIGVALLLVIAVGIAAFSILRRPMIAETPPVTVPVPVAVAPAAPAAAPAARTLAENELPPREGKKDDDKGPAEKGGDKAVHPGLRHPKGAVGGGNAAGAKRGAGDGAGRGEASGAGSSPPAEPDRAKPPKGSLDDLLEGALSNKARARAADNDSGGGSKRAPAGGGESAGGGGPLAKSAVVAGMNGIKGKVAACYNQYKVPGMAMVNVVIGKSGKVSSASVTGKFAGTPTGTCVENAVKSASFPPSDGLTTPYPFNLR